MKSKIHDTSFNELAKQNRKNNQQRLSKNAIKLLAVLFIAIISTKTNAQVSSERKSFTYGEFKAGYAVSQFGKNLEEKYDAGNFSTSGGGLFTLGAYHKFESINHFNFGGKFSALGATPSNGDNKDEMFFNWWGAAISAKYYPLNKDANSGFNVYGDFYFINQFTQKYRNVDANIYNHQFAIGSAISLGTAYDFKLAGYNFSASVEYGLASRTGEVTGVGKRTFGSSHIGAQVGFKF